MSGTFLGGPPTPLSSSSSGSTKKKKSNKVKKKENKSEHPKSPKVKIIKTDRPYVDGMSSEEEEDIEDYRKGGYHPVELGNVFNGRYKVKSKLGWGHFSTVWLAHDMVKNCDVALKIVKSDKHYTEAARDEIAILTKVTENDPDNTKCVVHLLDHFEHSGPNGTHVCMVFENLSCNLLTLIRMYNYKGLPIPLVKIITKQILIGLDYLHRQCSIIHTDLKPENVLLVKAPRILSKEAPQRFDFKTVEDRRSSPRRREDDEMSLDGDKNIASHSLLNINNNKKNGENNENNSGPDDNDNAMNVSEPPSQQRDSPSSVSSAHNNSQHRPTTLSSNPSVSSSTQHNESLFEGQTLDHSALETTNIPQTNPLDTSEENSTATTATKTTSTTVTANSSGGLVTSNWRVTCSPHTSTSSPNPNSSLLVEHASSGHEIDDMNATDDTKSTNSSHESSSSNYVPPNLPSLLSQPPLPPLPSLSPHSSLTSTPRKKAVVPYTKSELLRVFGDAYKVKIVDLGNACWTYKHFTDDVQTRQYRAPEVILGAKYDTAIDIWSMACIVFELLTGDLLFEPKNGKTFNKNDDHLAQMQELLGLMPKHIALCGKESKNYFNRKGELRFIKQLNFWSLKDVLIEKYHFSEKDATEISDFMLPMLHFSPARRATAQQMLQHPWIRDIDVNNFESAFQNSSGSNDMTSSTEDKRDPTA